MKFDFKNNDTYYLSLCMELELRAVCRPMLYIGRGTRHTMSWVYDMESSGDVWLITSMSGGGGGFTIVHNSIYIILRKIATIMICVIQVNVLFCVLFVSFTDECFCLLPSFDDR